MGLTRLVLLRHGETDFNAGGRIQGQLDSSLTERGRAQAIEIAATISSLDPDHLISSDLRRAADTAAEIGALTRLSVREDARLREVYAGQWQGMFRSEVDEQWPGAMDNWWIDYDAAPPGGESWREVGARASALVDDLEEQSRDAHDCTAVLVTHGGVILSLVTRLLRLPAAPFPTLELVANCHWVDLRHYGNGAWRLGGYNRGVLTAIKSKNHERTLV